MCVCVSVGSQVAVSVCVSLGPILAGNYPRTVPADDWWTWNGDEARSWDGSMQNRFYKFIAMKPSELVENENHVEK